MENYYDILGVPKTASDLELKKAYRSLSLQCHPDRNKDDNAVEKFQKINEAYEILGDPSKRQRYDMQSEMGDSPFGDGFFSFGQRDPFGMPPDMNHIFESFFASGMPGMGIHGMPGMGIHGMPNIRIFHNGKLHVPNQKPPPIEKQMPITLEQAYHGELAIIVLETMTQGRVEQESFHLNIPKGIQDGESIVIPDKGHMGPGNIRGDVHLTFVIQPHNVFKRQNNDLVCVKTISLKDALCGFTIEVQHLNGKILRLNNHSNRNVITPGYVKEVENYGMVRGNDTGKLIITFEISFPESITDIQMKLLEQVFP